ncbi:MAG TPA: hypothetical protein VN975_09165 [Xanthobacteraceae bacterium]|jgi:hypothetical protein|nr:hypothetical protein [Xanthobacteraceae bacterium]
MQILTFNITILMQLRCKPLERRQWLRRKYPDAPHMRALLRLRRERTCRHTAEQRDEIASSH